MTMESDNRINQSFVSAKKIKSMEADNETG